MLEFQLRENRIAGNTGCNQMSGEVVVFGSKMYISDLMRTKKMCQGAMDTEHAVIALLQGEVAYTIEEGTLVLNRDKFSARLKKVD